VYVCVYMRMGVFVRVSVCGWVERECGTGDPKTVTCLISRCVGVAGQRILDPTIHLPTLGVKSLGVKSLGVKCGGSLDNGFWTRQRTYPRNETI